MFGEIRGHGRRHRSMLGMDGADGVQQFPMQEVLQQVRSCSGFEGANYLNITRISCQDNDPGIGRTALTDLFPPAGTL
jgi:hypothetical protein